MAIANLRRELDQLRAVLLSCSVTWWKLRFLPIPLAERVYLKWRQRHKQAVLLGLSSYKKIRRCSHCSLAELAASPGVPQSIGSTTRSPLRAQSNISFAKNSRMVVYQLLAVSNVSRTSSTKYNLRNKALALFYVAKRSILVSCIAHASWIPLDGRVGARYAVSYHAARERLEAEMMFPQCPWWAMMWHDNTLMNSFSLFLVSLIYKLSRCNGICYYLINNTLPRNRGILTAQCYRCPRSSLAMGPYYIWCISLCVEYIWVNQFRSKIIFSEHVYESPYMPSHLI